MKVQYIVVEFPIFMDDNIEPIKPTDESALREWVMISARGENFKILSSDRVEDAHMG
jgi:hypothetical protein